MCIDTDLFGEVIVKKSEVEFWLDNVIGMAGRAQSQREHYAKIYDVANKIKLSKLDGSFYTLINRHESEQPKLLQQFDTVYKTDPVIVDKVDCPDWFHVCNDRKCPIFMKRIASQKAKQRWAKQKSRG